MTHDGWSITLSTRSNGTHTARSQAPWIVCVLLKTIPTCSFSALDSTLGLLPSPSLPLSCAVSVSPHHTVTSSALTTTPPPTTLPAPSLPIPASVCGKKQNLSLPLTAFENYILSTLQPRHTASRVPPIVQPWFTVATRIAVSHTVTEQENRVHRDPRLWLTEAPREESLSGCGQ
ncbi:hypothetical protein FALCPG4_008959 [Fusarium falciforme]